MPARSEVQHTSKDRAGLLRELHNGQLTVRIPDKPGRYTFDWCLPDPENANRRQISILDENGLPIAHIDYSMGGEIAANKGQLDNVFVAEEWRGNGLAPILISLAVEELSRQSTIILGEISQENEASLRALRAAEHVLTGERLNFNVQPYSSNPENPYEDYSESAWLVSLLVNNNA